VTIVNGEGAWNGAIFESLQLRQEQLPSADSVAPRFAALTTDEIRIQPLQQ
jgi:hypothetical protein